MGCLTGKVFKPTSDVIGSACSIWDHRNEIGLKITDKFLKTNPINEKILTYLAPTLNCKIYFAIGIYDKSIGLK